MVHSVCLNSGQIDVIGMEYFGSDRRRFRAPDVRRLYSLAKSRVDLSETAHVLQI